MNITLWVLQGLLAVAFVAKGYVPGAVTRGRSPDERVSRVGSDVLGARSSGTVGLTCMAARHPALARLVGGGGVMI